jgi:hypothetical protein
MEELGVVAEARFGEGWLGLERRVWGPRLLDLYPGSRGSRRNEAAALIKKAQQGKAAEMVIFPHRVRTNLDSNSAIGKSLNGFPGVLAGFPSLPTDKGFKTRTNMGNSLKKYYLVSTSCPGSA